MDHMIRLCCGWTTHPLYQHVDGHFSWQKGPSLVF